MGTAFPCLVPLTFFSTARPISCELSRAPDPSLPSADIIHLLAFGQTTGASTANATPANQAAETLVANQVSSWVTSRFSKVAGVSQLSINPVLAGTSEPVDPRLYLGAAFKATNYRFRTYPAHPSLIRSFARQKGNWSMEKRGGDFSPARSCSHR